MHKNCHLRKCCKVKPILKRRDKTYPGSVAYECPVCHKTTRACYSNMIPSRNIAMEDWNSGLISEDF